MGWGAGEPDPSQMDNGQWYPPHGERYFTEITEEEAVPPGVDRATYIDPEWHWGWKILKRLAPYDVQIGIGLYILIAGLMAPGLYRWYAEAPDEIETDDEDHPWANRFNYSMEDARRMLGDRRAERNNT